MLGAVAVVPWNPKNTKQRDGLPPTWTLAELGKRGGIYFGLQRPQACGWTAVVQRVALTYAAQRHGRPDLIRSPKRVLAHLWEGPMG